MVYLEDNRDPIGHESVSLDATESNNQPGYGVKMNMAPLRLVD